MLVVSNSSPVMNLAAIGQLDLLEKLYSKVTIAQQWRCQTNCVNKNQEGKGTRSSKKIENRLMVSIQF